MDRKSVEDLLRSVSQGGISVSDACERLAILPYQDLGFAKPDLHRGLRQGFPEVIFCPGKAPQQIVDIAIKLRASNSIVVATRVEEAQAKEVVRLYNRAAAASQNSGAAIHSFSAATNQSPSNGSGQSSSSAATEGSSTGSETSSTTSDAAMANATTSNAIASSVASSHVLEKSGVEIPLNDCEYLPQPKALVFGQLPMPKKDAPSVSIVTAGTADIAVAEEVALFIVAAGYPVSCVYDVGVAGVHRLFDSLALLRKAHVTVVVAGMDGALASFVGGLLDKPVIAVPTSIGYGASFEGVAALLSMLNSCAAGLTVVNIDNGFGAAMAALRILATAKG
ncbi:MAG: pyridinium-3,5-biscarboxylic acid mononucleotide synthase [Cyanobacteriota bacterium erpe_2018_sw_21hr_WHONDRS-SW48-000092_B_bin.40]|nr:pyridinium-3,5-biscarboxylic acid mononucleotide synthase [Cyanobacteriota bacterium erpe_2018_sw_21hr_WHONDRS-SW48-000092_B_bin.40]